MTDGTLKNKNKVPAAKVPRASAPAKTATVSAKVAKTDNASIGSSNLPVFLDIGSMVSTTATTVVKTEVPKVTVKKPAARITVPRRTSNTVKVAAPGLPGATPVTVKRTQVTTVTPNDLNPNPPKRVRPVAVAKPWKATGYRRPSPKRGCREGLSGRLSRLIVAFESRVTLLGRSL